MNENLIASGKKIIQTYQSTPSAQLEPFMRNVSGISNNVIQIYSNTGKPILSGQEFPLQVDPEIIESVLSGSIARDLNIGNGRQMLIGLPFEDKGDRYALFIMIEAGALEKMFINTLRTVLFIVLFIGSLLILVAARFIVKPLLLLTNATKHMAKGNFDIQLRTTRKDEIGQLTASFNEMAIELSKLDRMRQEFVTNVSHEIQTPLTSISGFTKALKRKHISEESRLHYLTIIEEESERLSRLSQNLLQLSHLQYEDHHLNLSSFRLDEQLRKVVIALETQWSTKEIGLELQLEEMVVQADEDQLNQVWINLLSNSIKFTPDNGTIHIKAVINGHLAIVSIADNGIGVPEEERLDIFKPFHKADKSRDGSIKGNGLGLSIVKQIIDIHHGDIKVSEQSGGGTIFTVQLPQLYTEHK